MSLRVAFPDSTEDLINDLLTSIGAGVYRRAAVELADIRGIVTGFHAILSEEKPRVRIDFAYNELLYAIDESIAMLENPSAETYWKLKLGVFVHYVACTTNELRKLAGELDPPPKSTAPDEGPRAGA